MHTPEICTARWRVARQGVCVEPLALLVSHHAWRAVGDCHVPEVPPRRTAKGAQLDISWTGTSIVGTPALHPLTRDPDGRLTSRKDISRSFASAWIFARGASKPFLASSSSWCFAPCRSVCCSAMKGGASASDTPCDSHTVDQLAGAAYFVVAEREAAVQGWDARTSFSMRA